MASHTVELIVFREETLGPDSLLAVAAGEAVLMPDGALVLHILVSCHNILLAPFAFGGGLLSGTGVAQDLVVPGHKGLTGQALKALVTMEAGIVPVAVLIMYLLGICTYELMALLTGIGTVLVKTRQAAV